MRSGAAEGADRIFSRETSGCNDGATIQRDIKR